MLVSRALSLLHPAGGAGTDARQDAGESVIAVAERLGHDDATLVLTTYGHLMPDSESRTRKAIDSAWNPDPADELRTAQ